MSIIISIINCLPEKLIGGYPPPFIIYYYYYYLGAHYFSFDFVNDEKAKQANYITFKAVIDR